MQRHAAVHNVTQAMRVLKSFPVQHPELAPIRELSRQAIKEALEIFMEQRIDRYLGDVRRGEAPDRRNGHYQRWLLTGMGAVELVVPRTRTRSGVGVLASYARRERSVDRLILAAFVLGLSTRKVGEALMALLGERVSPSTVSRVAEQLDLAVAAFHCRPLANRYRALVLDGVVLGSRSGRGVVHRSVLVALGITHDGRKEILDFGVARGESQAAWEAFLNDLYRRGLTGEGLAIVVVDGGAGLLAALPLMYPKAQVQRCWAHIAGRSPRLQRGGMSPLGQVPMSPIAWGQAWWGNSPRRSRPDMLASGPSPEAPAKPRAAPKGNAFGAVNASRTSIAGRVRDWGGRASCVMAKTITTVDAWGEEAVVAPGV